MKNTIKLILTFALILALSVVLLLTGCGKKDKGDCYIAKSDLPRTSYVQGQSLDLSKGYLTVSKDGKEEKIPFTSDKISFSGYDMNTLGEQKVTVSYGSLSTTFNISVVSRITAEGFDTKYFVGDNFNKSKGKLKVASDDAKISSVNFDSEKVSLVSFDSTSAGQKTITLRYTNGSISYDCQFEVTVYEAASVEYTAPKNNTYYNHNAVVTDKDVKDGYFIVTSSDNTLKKTVYITADMVSGYHPEEATIAHREDALRQKLTITYLGKTYDYNVKVYFSGVSIVNYYVNGILKDLNLSGTLTDAQNLAAMDAVSELLKLSRDDRAKLTEETINTVITTAAVGVSGLFMDEVLAHQNGFLMDETGALYLTGVDYASTKAALNAILDPNSQLNKCVSILRLLSADYGEYQVTAKEQVKDIAVAYSPEAENSIIPILEHIITVHEYFANIEPDWTRETLKAKGVYILDAMVQIKRAEYVMNDMGYLYSDILSGWREKDDLLEIVYTYFVYLYDGDDADSYMQTNIFGYFPMPEDIQTVFDYLMMTYEMQTLYYQYQYDQLWLADLSRMAVCYFLTLDLANELKNSGDQFVIDIYNKFDMDYVIDSYTAASYFGFSYHAGTMLDSENFMAMWRQYYVVLSYYMTEQLDGAKHEGMITSLFNIFQSMTPNEVYGFLSSMNLNYNVSRGSSPVLMLDGEKDYNIFAEILRVYFMEYLTDTNKAIFPKLLLAIESAALFGENENTLGNFVGLMEEVIAAYKKLEGEDLRNFEKYLGTSYEKYLAIYNRITGAGENKLTDEEKALFNKLVAELNKFEEIYLYVSSLTSAQFSNAHYYLFYSAYAKLSATYNEIMATGSEALRAEVFSVGHTYMDMPATVGKAYYYIDEDVSMMLLSSHIAVKIDGHFYYTTMWDVLYTYGMMDFLVDAYDFFYFTLCDNTATLDAKTVAALQAAIDALPEKTRLVLDEFGTVSCFYRAKAIYLETTLKADEALSAAATALSSAAAACERYENYPYNTTYQSEFATAMESAKALYDALTDAQKAELVEVYNFYLASYEAMKAE